MRVRRQWVGGPDEDCVGFCIGVVLVDVGVSVDGDEDVAR